MRRALALLCLTGCVVEGSTEVALKGSGAVKVDPATGNVTLDTAQVPILPACAAGQLVRRSDDGAGWSCATLAEAGAPTVTWAGIDGKPSTFPPDAHTHPVAQLDDLHWDTLPGKPNAFTPLVHSHVAAEINDFYDQPDLQWADAGSAIYATKSTGLSPAVRDQSQMQFDTTFFQSGSTQLWQSFTSSTSGYLAGFRIFTPSSSGTYSFLVRIYAGEGTAGSDLYSDAHTSPVVSDGAGGGWLQFNLPSKRVSLRDGVKYTFAFTHTTGGGGSIQIRYENAGDRYAGGRAVMGTTDDLMFETLVNHENGVAVTADGRIGVGTRAPNAMLDVVGDSIRIRGARTPSASTAPCYQGEIAWDEEYLYVCIQPNRWRRVQLNLGGW